MQGTSFQTSDSSSNMRLIGHTNLDGQGDGMHIALKDGYAYFGHMSGAGTSVIDVRDPADPRFVTRFAPPQNTHSHKVQVVGDVMLVNRERIPESLGGNPKSSWASGISVYDVSSATDPLEIGFWSCGGRGVHRMTYWAAPYAYAAAAATDLNDRCEGLSVVDFSDPTNPVEVGRWWLEGMSRSDRDLRTWGADREAKVHHAIPRGDRLFVSLWDLGFAILDISDPSFPTLISHVDVNAVDGPSNATHTVYPIPGRDLLVVADECMKDGAAGESYVRIFDISDERVPRFVTRLPTPQGDYVERGGRSGPHNLHEGRPGLFQSSRYIFVTWFNAGIRVFDIIDPENPREVGFYVPKAPVGEPAIQLNDLIVDKDGLIYVSDRRTGGLYILEFDAP